MISSHPGTTSIPEQGQLVEVRRRYVVTEVLDSTFKKVRDDELPGGDLDAESGSTEDELLVMSQRLVQEKVREHRNLLAHGGIVNDQIAVSLRDSILGDKNNPGPLYWLVKNLDPGGGNIIQLKISNLET